MKNFRVVPLILLVLFLSNCSRKDKNDLYGKWREYYNGTVVYTFEISKDKICYRSVGEKYGSICEPYFIFNNKIYSKENYFLLLEPGRELNKDIFIRNPDIATNIILRRIKSRSNPLQIKIVFDVVEKRDSSIIYGLGVNDYELYSDGSYVFYTNHKVHKGKISGESNNQLRFYLGAMDTTENKLVPHSFDIGSGNINYILTFYYRNKTRKYCINKSQPMKMVEVNYWLDGILHEILYNSGYQLL